MQQDVSDTGQTDIIAEQYINIHEEPNSVYLGLFAFSQACLTVVCVAVLQALAGTQSPWVPC